MNNQTNSNIHFSFLFKSTAAALIFSALLGPVGLLYSSLTGGVIMLVLGLLVFRLKLWALMVLVWVGSCVWSVGATNRFNKKLFQTLTK